MPRDVTMPQLGMAQDAGKIVAWLKAPGDPVAEGDALFEVETDKATMEVEAQAAGFLTGVTAQAGDDVPVGAVIAQISDSAEEDSPAPAAPAKEPDAEGAQDLPEGNPVTMPQLGMAQDTGLLVNWLKSPGDAVSAGDVLFEVETDKSTMEVEAGSDGYLAATLAQAGEEVPVGDPVAIISVEKPDAPVTRSVKKAASAPAPKEEAQSPAPAKTGKAEKAPAPGPKPAAASADGRILASPKARRLALEQGLDLARLVQAGHPQPFHVADLEVLRSLPADAPAPVGAAATPARRLTASVPQDGFAAFATWAAKEAGLGDPAALLAGLAAASLGADTATVAVETPGGTKAYTVPAGPLSGIAQTEADTPDLRLRDLRLSRITSVAQGPEDAPVMTLTPQGDGLSITLECAAEQLAPAAALALLSDFAGRMEQPLRHLL
ncbi:biotin/lipoyl-containing protein [Thalassococcus sp. BH17M4-6]|uniref:biotin/lipoyl-containing protein n=1 Tax=Thalassococcus sp. BH17M4-6 TaxID=3413148 RepID=UPI003BC30771